MCHLTPESFAVRQRCGQNEGFRQVERTYLPEKGDRGEINPAADPVPESLHSKLS